MSTNTFESGIISKKTKTSVVIIKPILYGNTAKHFGSKRDSDGHTHKWILYVRAFDNDDMSRYISRVQFRLHETYSNNIRVVHQAPFEIEESGWGEFETQITIFFIDPNEKPVIFYHHLKLFSTDPEVVTGKKPLTDEYYDELIFQAPSDFFAQVLSSTKTFASSSNEKEYTTKKVETLTRIKTVRQRVRNEIDDLTERLRITQENIKRIRERSIDTTYPSEIFSSLTNEIED